MDLLRIRYMGTVARQLNSKRGNLVLFPDRRNGAKMEAQKHSFHSPACPTREPNNDDIESFYDHPEFQVLISQGEVQILALGAEGKKSNVTPKIDNPPADAQQVLREERAIDDQVDKLRRDGARDAEEKRIRAAAQKRIKAEAEVAVKVTQNTP